MCGRCTGAGAIPRHWPLLLGHSQCAGHWGSHGRQAPAPYDGGAPVVLRLPLLLCLADLILEGKAMHCDVEALLVSRFL